MEENLRSERKEMILSFVQDKDYRPIRTKEMANLFGVPKRDRSDFHELLDELIREGKIEIDRRGMIRLPENRIFTGTFMATRKGFGSRGKTGMHLYRSPYVPMRSTGIWYRSVLRGREERGAQDAVRVRSFGSLRGRIRPSSALLQEIRMSVLCYPIMKRLPGTFILRKETRWMLPTAIR